MLFENVQMMSRSINANNVLKTEKTYGFTWKENINNIYIYTYMYM